MDSLLKELNQITKKFQGIIVYITISDISNKVIIHLNMSIKTVDNYKDSVVKLVLETIKKHGKYKDYRVCVSKGN